MPQIRNWQELKFYPIEPTTLTALGTTISTSRGNPLPSTTKFRLPSSTLNRV
ncbi:MAG: hypothetical protein M3220_03445 [Chloroflexota bacterium]|nr:hypothetical protein [Chloroflexota bacterium]